MLSLQVVLIRIVTSQDIQMQAGSGYLEWVSIRMTVTATG